VFLGKKHNFPALADGCEECLRIEIAPLLGRRTWTHLVSAVALISHANFDGLLGVPHPLKMFVGSNV
jgi:hypothetical protein